MVCSEGAYAAAGLRRLSGRLEPLVVHATEFDKRDDPFPQEIAVRKRCERVGGVDGQWSDDGVGARLIEERYGVALDARAQDAVLGCTYAAGGPLLEYLPEIHYQCAVERRYIDPTAIPRVRLQSSDAILCEQSEEA